MNKRLRDITTGNNTISVCTCSFQNEAKPVNNSFTAHARIQEIKKTEISTQATARTYGLKVSAGIRDTKETVVDTIKAVLFSVLYLLVNLGSVRGT